MPVSTTLNDLSKLALVASDASYFTTSFPGAHESALPLSMSEIRLSFRGLTSRPDSSSLNNFPMRQASPQVLRPLCTKRTHLEVRRK